MRQRDFDEIAALSEATDRHGLATVLATRYGGAKDIFTLVHEGRPVAILGCVQTRPGVVSLLFFASPQFDAVRVSFTRFAKKDLRKALFDNGVHRVECVSLAGYKAMHAWLRLVGLTQEGEPMAAYGRNGEAFVRFALINPDYHPPGA